MPAAEYVWLNVNEAEPALFAVVLADDEVEPSFQFTVALSVSLAGAVQEIAKVTLWPASAEVDEPPLVMQLGEGRLVIEMGTELITVG